MKTFDFKAMFLLVAITFLLMAMRLNAIDVKMAWDFRTNEWQTIEFTRDTIRIYNTKEDVTESVKSSTYQNKTIFYIEDKQMVEKFKGVKYSRATKIYYAFKDEQLMKFTAYNRGAFCWENSRFKDQDSKVSKKWVDKTEEFIKEYETQRWIQR